MSYFSRIIRFDKNLKIFGRLFYQWTIYTARLWELTCVYVFACMRVCVHLYYVYRLSHEDFLIS